MFKYFNEVLKDGFNHVTDITDIDFITACRQEGIRIDEEGYYTISFGDNKEFELRVLPFGDDGIYLVSVYKNNTPITIPLPIKKYEET